jgi:hypothetical protein
MGICDPARPQTRTCILNVGLYRTGSTTLTQAAENTVLRVYHKFPDLNKEEHKLVLVNPREAVLQWWTQEAQEAGSCTGENELLGLPHKYDLLGDNWIALLPFLPTETLDAFFNCIEKDGIKIEFVVTRCDQGTLVASKCGAVLIYCC